MYIKIQLEEQLEIKYYTMKLFTLVVIKNIIDIKDDLLQWSIKKFFDEKFSGGVIKSKVDTCADTATLND